MKDFPFARRILSILLALVAAFACLCMLGGCQMFGQNTNTNSEQSDNCKYMNQISAKVSTLNTTLDDFAKAVSEGDKVTMRTQAASASKTLDEIGALSAPDELKDVAEAYKDGCSNMKTALNSYVDLYVNSDAAPTSEQIAAVKQSYQAAVDSLKKADDLAAGKE